MSLFIHVGLIKTGTTTLQKRYFPNHPDIYYLGKHGYAVDAEKRVGMYAALNHLCRADGINYDPQLVRDGLAAPLEVACATGKVIGMSDEKFTMHHRADRKLIAGRIREQFGDDTKVIITIRKQMGVIDSLCLLETLGGVHDSSFSKPIYWLQDQINANGVLQTVDYYNLYNAYVSVFGADNVKLVLFEQFVRDKKAFLQEIGDFCGFAAREDLLKDDFQDNSRESQRWLNFVRFRKHYVGEYVIKGLGRITPEIVKRQFDRFIRQGPKARVDWPVGVTEQINNLYADGNAKLGELLGVDLKAYGYVVEKTPVPEMDPKYSAIVPHASWLPSGFDTFR